MRHKSCCAGGLACLALRSQSATTQVRGTCAVAVGALAIVVTALVTLNPRVGNDVAILANSTLLIRLALLCSWLTQEQLPYGRFPDTSFHAFGRP